MEPSGSTLMKIRFVEVQGAPIQHEQVTKQNSNIHFKRKSESQLKRDKARSMQHRNRVCSGVATRSMVTSTSKGIDTASDNIEMPRFGLVDSAMTGENQFHMPNTHDNSTLSSTDYSDPLVATEPEQSPGLELYNYSPEPVFNNEQIDMPTLDLHPTDDMNEYYDNHVMKYTNASDIEFEVKNVQALETNSLPNNDIEKFTYVHPKSRNSEPPDKNFQQEDYLMKPDVDLTQSLDCIYSIV